MNQALLLIDLSAATVLLFAVKTAVSKVTLITSQPVHSVYWCGKDKTQRVIPTLPRSLAQTVSVAAASVSDVSTTDEAERPFSLHAPQSQMPVPDCQITVKRKFCYTTTHCQQAVCFVPLS